MNSLNTEHTCPVCPGPVDSSVLDKLALLDQISQATIQNCLSIRVWAAKPENREEVNVDDPKIHALCEIKWKGVPVIPFAAGGWTVEDGCFFSERNLHRAFPKLTRDQLTDLLKLLQDCNVVSASITASSIGRPKTLRFLPNFWNELMELQLIDSLMKRLVPLGAPKATVAEAPTPIEGSPEAIQPTPSEYPSAVRVLKDCSLCHNGVRFKVSAGTILTDWGLCKELIDNGYPVVAVDDKTTISCVNLSCGKSFDITAGGELEVKPIVYLEDVRFNYGNVVLIRKKGQLEADRHLLEFLLQSSLPISFVRPEEYAVCPHCNEVFMRPLILGAGISTSRPLVAPAVSVPIESEQSSTVCNPPAAAQMEDPLYGGYEGQSFERVLEQRFWEP